jgi:hypothetical protein
MSGQTIDYGALVERKRQPSLSCVVKELERTMRCNCDLDNWEPERDTGHSWVCRIHKAAKERVPYQPNAAAHVRDRSEAEGR